MTEDQEEVRERMEREVRYRRRWPLASRAFDRELVALGVLAGARAAHTAAPSPETTTAVTAATAAYRAEARRYKAACAADQGAWRLAHPCETSGK